MQTPRIASVVAAGLLLLPPCPSGEAPDNVVTLRVIHDGLEIAPPSRVTLGYDDHTLRLKLRNARFRVPPEALRAKQYTLSFDVAGDQIRIRGIKSHDFRCRQWRVVLADEAYGHDWQWSVRDGTDVRSSCIVAFDAEEGDGTFILVPGCRTTRHEA